MADDDESGGQPPAAPSDEDVAKLEEVMGKLRGLLEPSLEPGERIEAVAMGMRPRLMRSTMNAVAITEGRLLLQPAGPDWTPIGDVVAYRPEEIAAFTYSLGEDNFRNRALQTRSTVIDLVPAAGRKFRLVMMRGGASFFGRHGEQAQADEIAAIIAWLESRVGS